MSDQKYIRHDLSNCLSHVIEECGEVCMAAGKILRFSWDSYNPELPQEKQEPNSVWLRRELSDLKQAIERLESAMEKEYL